MIELAHIAPTKGFRMKSYLVGIKDASGEYEGEGMPITAMSEDEAIEAARMYFPEAPYGFWILLHDD